MSNVRHTTFGGIALALLLALVLGSSTPAVHLADGPAGDRPKEKGLTIQASDLALTKVGPAVVRPGGEITYQLTITNTGPQAATDLIVQDVLPPNTAYVSGGTLTGDRVQWTIPNLAGYGGVAEKTLVLAADAPTGTTIENDTYSAWNYSGQAVDGTVTVETRIVDDWAWLTPWETYTLTHSSPDVATEIILPAGTVSEPLTLSYEELDQALHPLAFRTRTSFSSFRLSFFQFRRPAPTLLPTFSFSVTMSFTDPLGTLSTVDEPLQLYRWDRGHWRKEGITCLNEPGNSRVACNIAPQALGEFVLTQAQHDVYLPIVFSGYERK